MILNRRLSLIAPSPTLAISAKAKALKREGRDIVGFGAGEPDFDTPEPIKEAARRALSEGKTKYTPAAGLVELREALAESYADKWGLDYSLDQILVSCGAKHSLYNVFSALLNEGDEVLVPSPYWVSYPAQVLLAGGTPIDVPTAPADNFCPSNAALDAAVSERTRAIILNTPSNPTGACWSRADVERLADWLVAHPGVLALYDSIYEALIYGDAEYVELASLRSQLPDQVVCINGVSKAYAMTGWRIGWALGPRPLLAAMAKLQSQSTSGPNTIAQWAALGALRVDREVVESMRVVYDQRRELICAGLEAIPDVVLQRPNGAFYAFPDFGAYIGGRTPGGAVIADDVALAGYLLDSVGVALVPGSAFGAPGFARLTYACDEATILKGVDRLGEALGRIQR
jgi:aspartate aminotransferase